MNRWREAIRQTGDPSVFCARNHFAWAFGLAAAVLAWQLVSFRAGFPGDFGAEHGNVAAALAGGRGFSNPFGTESGPTA